MRTILITGCNGKLAQELVKFFIKKEDEFRIVGCDIHNSLSSSLIDHVDSIKYFQTDLESKSSIQELIEKLIFADIIPDVLINNAAIDSVPAVNSVDDGMSLENFSQVFNVNVRAPIYLFKLLSAEWIRKDLKAKVINLSTIYSKVAPDPSLYQSNFKKSILYGSSKAALNSAFKQLSVLYSNTDIRINSLVLAGIESNGQDPDFKRKYTERIPAKRFLRTAEIFSAIYFLMDNANSYMNGAELVIDGGYTNI